MLPDEELALDHDMDMVPDLQAVDFKLPPPKELTEEEQTMLVRNSLGRIWDGAKDLAPSESMLDAASDTRGASAIDMWMLLLVRLVTRVTDPARFIEVEDEEMEGVSARRARLTAAMQSSDWMSTTELSSKTPNTHSEWLYRLGK